MTTVEEKSKKMIDKAIDKIGISRDLIDMNNCHYPISKIVGPNGVIHELDEKAVCITVNPFNSTILIFGLEDKEDDDKEMPQV